MDRAPYSPNKKPKHGHRDSHRWATCAFVDDLDADSLALIELVEALEEELSDRTTGFRIEDEDLEDLKTVRDAVDYVHERAS